MVASKDRINVQSRTIRAKLEAIIRFDRCGKVITALENILDEALTRRRINPRTLRLVPAGAPQRKRKVGPHTTYRRS